MGASRRSRENCEWLDRLALIRWMRQLGCSSIRNRNIGRTETKGEQGGTTCDSPHDGCRTALQGEPRGSPRRETKHKLIKPALATKNANKPESPKEIRFGPKPILCPIVSRSMKIISSTNHWQNAAAKQAEIKTQGICRMQPNDAGHWRAVEGATNSQEMQSARPLNQPG